MDDDFYLLKAPNVPTWTRTAAAFSYYGPNEWNGLPYYLRCMTDIDLFKKALKCYYFNMAFEGII